MGDKVSRNQSEWFSKRGISWHVSSVITRQDEVLEVICYVHLLDNCHQGWYVVLVILENCLIAIRESVTAETGLIHPILYDVYDGCKFAKEEKLLTFKVKMLRELCHVLSVHSKHEIKADLVARLMEMISKCSCLG